MRVQLKTAKTASAHGVPHGVDRAFHAKSTLAVDNAELRFLDLPADLRAGFAQPGASYPAVVRFSNASGIPQADTEPDLRGVALRVQVSPEETHDLLMTNYPVSHARDANQFVEFAKATAGGGISRLLGIVGLLRLFGLDETKRMLKNVMTARRRSGDQRGHRDVLEPRRDAVGARPWRCGTCSGRQPARRRRLRLPRTTRATSRTRRRAASLQGDVRLELCIQRYVDDVATPIEDTAVEWSEQRRSARAGRRAHHPARRHQHASMRWRRPGSSTRWPSTRGTRPTSSGRSATSIERARPSTTRARRTAWATAGSRSHRCATRWPAPLRAQAYKVVNRYVEWHRLPVPLGLLNLEVFRHVLRKENLLDTELREAPPAARPVPPAPPDEKLRVARTADGSSNDLSAPAMGAVGLDVRPQPADRTTGRICSTSRIRSS